MFYSIIIPTFNQSNKLNQSLAHITRLHFDKTLYEIIVVDNGSKDDTKEISEKYLSQFANFKYIYCSVFGLMAARHAGLYTAKGNILCYLDDDSLVGEHWLEGLNDSFMDPDVVLVTGPCIPKYEIPPPKWLSYYNIQTEYGIVNYYLSLVNFGEQKKQIPARYVFGCNYSIRKEVLVNIGGTCPDYLPPQYSEFMGNGETGIANNVASYGKALYHPLVRIDHLIPKNRLTPEYFSWRAFYNGIGDSYTQNRTLFNSKDGFVFIKSILKGLWVLLGKIKAILLLLFASKTKEYRYIYLKIITNYMKGYLFHSKKFYTNLKLREWVSKKTYLDNNGDVIEFLKEQ